MGEADAVPGVVKRLSDDDPGGIDELFARFAGRLTRVAKAHLSK
jgi:hypothetical protein